MRASMLCLTDDDDIETTLRVRYVDVSGPARDTFSEPSAGPSGIEARAEMDVDGEPSLREHGILADGEQAFCRLTSGGLIDCPACLEQARRTLFRELEANERTAFDGVLVALDEAGSGGLTKQELLVSRQTLL